MEVLRENRPGAHPETDAHGRTHSENRWTATRRLQNTPKTVRLQCKVAVSFNTQFLMRKQQPQPEILSVVSLSNLYTLHTVISCYGTDCVITVFRSHLDGNEK